MFLYPCCLKHHASVNPPPPPGYCRAFARLVHPGGGAFANFALPGAGYLPTQGHSRAFDTHAVSYQNITTQKVLLDKKNHIGSSVKDRNKLKRVVKVFLILCMHFFIAYQARITERNWSYRCESTFFGY